jgi:hypothetical protein
MEMYTDVHVDEKWFFLTRKQRRYKLAKDEADPHRTINHKSHVDKVMFLCAQARPRKDYARNKSWDGKIGIWPIGEYTQYIKQTKNHKPGDPKWANKNMDSKLYCEYLGEVVRNITEKWPRTEWNDPQCQIRIQQNGARVHTSDSFHFEWEIMLQDLTMEGVLPVG